MIKIGYRARTTLSYGERDGFIEELTLVPVWRLVVVWAALLIDTMTRHWFCEGVLDRDDDLPDDHWRVRTWDTWQYLAALDHRSKFYVDRGYRTTERAREIDPEFVETVLLDD